MRPTVLLDLATDLLRRVLQLQHPADGVVSDFFRQHRELGPRERHALADTTYAVLRQRPLLEHLAQAGHGPLERRLALLGWQGTAALLDGALHASERDWLAQARSVDRATLPDALRHNLPEWLATRLRAAVGEDDFWPLVESLNAPAPLDLRVNTLKARRDDVRAALAADGIAAEPTPWSPLGLRVQGRPAISKRGVFLRGEVEVQDEGSQLLVLATDPKRGEMVVDFCAGAGGKTLALGAQMRSTGRLYAFDSSGHRLAALKPRVVRSGLSNVHPAQISGGRDERVRRLAGKIDRVLVDAPCSGLGTLRRNPDLKWRQTPQTVAALRVTQQAILEDAARLVKPGGRLVYATCSLLAEEDEAIAEAFSAGAAGRDFVPLDVAALLEAARVARAGELVARGCLRLWPHRHGTDGFFAAAWQRR